MGLDVYLYRYKTDRADLERRQSEYEAASDKAWAFGGAEYEKLTALQKDTARDQCAAAAATLGLDEHGSPKESERETIEIDSAKYPEHLFKVGYFRSSYNGGGIDAVLSRLIETNLGELFGENHEGGEMIPNWVASRKRCQAAIKKLKTKMEAQPWDAVPLDSLGGLSPTFKGAEDEAQAIAIAARVLGEKRHSDFSSFMNQEGHWFAKGHTFYGFVEGRRFNTPCLYGIVKKTAEDLDFYVQALEICIETCDYVLAQPNPEQFFLYWSR